MATSLNQESARIYQFPTGGRAAIGGRRLADANPAKDATATLSNAAACSGSWYHAAAIEEAKSTKPTWER